MLQAWMALLGLLRWPGAWDLASLPAFTCCVWLLGPGLAQPPAPREADLGGAHKTLSLWTLHFLCSPRCLVCSMKFFQVFLVASVDVNNGGNLPSPCLVFSTASVVGQVMCPAHHNHRASSFSSMKWADVESGSDGDTWKIFILCGWNHGGLISVSM